jgi:hypothetical protein
LSDALANALALYGQSLPKPSLSCKAVEKLDLKCFLDRSSWKGMLALNRPVVLELELQPQQKSFVLLTGWSGEQAWIKTERVRRIPINSLLQYWDGYYLLLWRPPVKNVWVLVKACKLSEISRLLGDMNCPSNGAWRIDMLRAGSPKEFRDACHVR